MQGIFKVGVSVLDVMANILKRTETYKMVTSPLYIAMSEITV